METATDSLSDVLSVDMLSSLIDWAERDPLLSRVADPQHTLLCGHSRVRPIMLRPRLSVEQLWAS